MSSLTFVARHFLSAVGVLAIASGVSYGVLRAFARPGPVIENVVAPRNFTRSVEEGGELAFMLSLIRHQSCPGTVNATFSLAGDRPENITIPRPVKSTEIKQTDDILVRIVLPASVHEGEWDFTYSVVSECPLSEQTDILVHAPLTITRKG